MRKFWWALALVLMTGGLSCSCDKLSNKVVDKPLVILFDNDVHCGNDANGYAQAVGLRAAINSSDTAYCALVSSGDYIQGGIIGSESRGADMITILNKAKYDVVTVGNHEFDFGMERLMELLGRLNAPVTCANLTKVGSDKTLFEPYVMFTLGAKKVAAIGALTPLAMSVEKFSFYDDEGNQLYDLNVPRISDMVQAAVDEARRKGADYVIVLSHLGEDEADYNSVKLISETTGIDVVLDGHSHSIIPCRMVRNSQGVEVPLAQTGTKFKNLGKLYFATDGSVNVSLMPVDSIAFSDSEVASVVDSLKNVIDRKFGEVIGHNDYLLTINGADGKRAVRREDTNLSNFVTDAFRVVTGAQIGLENGGLIRVDVPAGDITRKMLLEAVPFGYDVQIVSLTGKEIATYLNIFAKGADGVKEVGAFPQVSGIRYRIHVGAEPLVTFGDIEIYDSESGTYVPVEPDGEYTMAVTGFAFDIAFEECGQGSVVKQGFGTEYEVLQKYFMEYLGAAVPSQYAVSQKRIEYVF